MTEWRKPRRSSSGCNVVAREVPVTEGHLALAVYYLFVPRDNRRTLEQFTLGLRVPPNHVVLLSWAGLSEQYLGRWEAALQHFRQAYTLDPRSITAARTLAYAFLMTRRYPEALAVVDRALELEPAARFFQLKAMIHLAQGNLLQARAVVREALRSVEAVILVAYFEYYWDLYWLLEEPEQPLLLQLPPSAFDNNRASWGPVRAQTHPLGGDHGRAAAYADSARSAFDEQLKAAPEDPASRAPRPGAGVHGRGVGATRAGDRAVALAPISKDEQSLVAAYVQHQLVRTYLLMGEP